MRKVLLILFFILAVFPIPLQAADSILDPMYNFMDVFYSNNPPSIKEMFKYTSGNDLDHPFRQKLREEKGLYSYVKWVDPSCSLPQNTGQEVLLDYVRQHYDQFPSLAAIWLRNKIGHIDKIEIQKITLHVTQLLDPIGYERHQPVRAFLLMNGHHIELIINWQIECNVGFPVTPLVLWRIDGDSFYDTAVREAKTTCVKCWFE